MTPLQIEYFLSVAKTKSITKSADELYVSVPAISKQLTALEKEIGLPLMTRSYKGIQLTAAGREFYEYFSRTTAEFEELKHRLAVKAMPSQPFRLGILEDWLLNYRFTWLEQYLRHCSPPCELQIIPLSLPELQRDTEAGRLDAALCVDNAFFSSLCQSRLLQQEPLCEIRRVLVYNHNAFPELGKIVDACDFADKTLLSLSNKYKSMVVEENCLLCNHYGFQPAKIRTYENLKQIIADVYIGRGFTFLDVWSIYAKDHILSTIELGSTYNVSLFWPSKNTNPLQDQVLEALRDIL